MAEGGGKLARWGLVLGRFAEPGLGVEASSEYARMGRVLDYLYGREYGGRGTRTDAPSSQGGDGDSRLTVPEWIREVRDLFPSEVCDVVTKHALERYELTDLVTDADTLERLEPDFDLLKSVLTFRGMMGGRVLEVARRVVERVVADLRRKLENEVRRALLGRADRNRRTRLRQARNLHLQRTLRASLRHWDPEERRLVAADLRFFSRLQRRVQWEIIVCVDCSGSMLDSVIHSAVVAAIFHGLPSIRVRLVAFDTNVVDLSEHVDDPVEVLMSVQLGGGTDIGRAVRYCATLVDNPTRTMLVLVTDFFEGGSPATLVGSIKELRGAGVRVLGLAALDSQCAPHYDHGLAGACAEAGADVAALTPGRLSEWVARVIG